MESVFLLEDRLLDQIADALICADAQGVVRVWNSGATAMFGFPAAEAIGLRLDFLIPVHLREAHWIAFDRAMATGKLLGHKSVRTTRATHKDGSKVYVDFTFSLVRDRFGKVVGSVAVGRETPPRTAQASSTAACAAAATLPAAASEPCAGLQHAHESDQEQ